MMGDRRGVRGEEPGIEPPHAAGRGDRARNQEQPGRVGQQAGLAKRLPGAFERGRGAIALASEAKAGFLAGLADRGDRQRARPRRRDLRDCLSADWLRAASGSARRPECGCLILSTRPPGKTNLPGMNTTLSWRLPTRTFGVAAAAIDQDQRGGIHRAAIGVMVGFLFVLSRSLVFAHLAPADLIFAFLV